MIERLYIKDLQKELPFHDRRTLKKWCKANGVGTFKDTGSNKIFVLRAEFELAKNNREIIKYLKDKYGEESTSEIINNENSFIEDYLRALICKENREAKTLQNQDSYIPQGEHEKNFLNSLQKF